MKNLLIVLFVAIFIPVAAQQMLPKVSSGRLVRIENFHSSYIAPRCIDIWLPKCYDGKKKVAVLYMNDGQMLFDSTASWNHQAWDVDDVAGALMDQGTVRDFIVVGIWNGGATRHAEYFPQKPFELLSKAEKDSVIAQLQSAGRGNKSFSPESDSYLKFIVKELKPYIDKNYLVYTEPESTFIAGSSMGGLISLYAICEYPNIFGGAACLSTHWPGSFTLDNNPFPNALMNYLDKKLPKPDCHKIYFDCGDQKLDSLYPQIQKRMDELMIKRGYSGINWLTIYAKGEEHNEKAWKSRFHIPLLFLLNREISGKTEKLSALPFGSIAPTGWLNAQMQRDIDGFVGNLDRIVPDLMNDPIYGKGRLHKNSKSKDLGNHKEGDAEGDEQYKWWNSETQSNWWDGYLRNSFLLDNKKGIKKVKSYVQHILSTQDEDGYLGIYDKELRYKFNSENGELWSKATLYRGLLAYYEYTGDEKVLMAVQKGVSNVMTNYPINASSPFSSGNSFNGGVSHGLTFTDVLEKMYCYTKDEKYRKYALFLYRDFSNTYQSEADVQLKNILDSAYRLKSHGVHTFEHMRSLIIARYASESEQLRSALDIYLRRVQAVTTISGGAIGDEWIAGRSADATHTGYEYCSLQELLDSYCLLLQKSGIAEIGDAIERTFYNAAQGARDPYHSAIAYLKTDNSYAMSGGKNDEKEPDVKQTRYKYSPAHQDVAVCCSPNAGRISPYFIQNSWMKENETTLVATLLMPNILKTKINGNIIQIKNVTQYPYENRLRFKITQANQSHFTLKIRKPSWVQRVVTKERFQLEDGFIVIERDFKPTDSVDLTFDTEIEVKRDRNGAHYFTYGALLYALPIKAKELQGRVYGKELTDRTYQPISSDRYSFNESAKPKYKNGKIEVELMNQHSGKLAEVELIPLGKTILRQVTFE